MKSVTIVVVAYKSTHIITNLLDKIVNKLPIKIIDNASNDDLEDILNKKYPNSGIELTILQNNVGFGRANNLALESIKTDYALILNPDAVINEDSIARLAKCLEENPKIATCGPIVTTSKKPAVSEIKESIKNHENAFGKHIIHSQYNEVPFLCGGFLMINMKICRKIGFFDKNIFLYYEDEELSKRILANNYKNALVKEAFCSHFESNSTKTKSKIESAMLTYKRNWHIGWSKSYLKKKKLRSVIFSTTFKIITSVISLIKLKPTEFLSKIGKQFGIISYCLGIDCFNSKNKEVKVLKKTVI